VRYVALIAVVVLALVTQAGGILLPSPLVATSVWVFGDSNVDTGWFKIFPFMGKPAYDAFLQNASALDIGRPTNNPGPMLVEVLAALLQATAASPANQGSTKYAPAARRMQKQ